MLRRRPSAESCPRIALGWAQDPRYFDVRGGVLGASAQDGDAWHRYGPSASRQQAIMVLGAARSTRLLLENLSLAPSHQERRCRDPSSGGDDNSSVSEYAPTLDESQDSDAEGSLVGELDGDEKLALEELSLDHDLKDEQGELWDQEKVR